MSREYDPDSIAQSDLKAKFFDAAQSEYDPRMIRTDISYDMLAVVLANRELVARTAVPALLDALEEADNRLLQYGWHLSTCESWDPEEASGECDCGFEETFHEASARLASFGVPEETLE